MLKYFIRALEWLSGKKSALIGILALIVTFLLSEGIITQSYAVLFNGILVILGGGASYATKKLVYNK